jgi:uncharacterized protein (DUF4415 family)
MSEASTKRRFAGKIGKTDWSKLERLSEDEIAEGVASDPDAAPLLKSEWFERATVVDPKKKAISIRLDQEVIDYFKGDGEGYQTRINNVLRAFMELDRRRG